MTTVGSDNKFPKVFLEEVANDGSATDIPVADHRALFLGEDGLLHLKDSAAAVTDVGSGLSDPMTTRGDMIVRNASNVTARLGRGSASQVLTSDGTDIAWATPSAGGGTAYGQAVSYPTSFSGDTVNGSSATPFVDVAAFDTKQVLNSRILHLQTLGASKDQRVRATLGTTKAGVFDIRTVISWEGMWFSAVDDTYMDFDIRTSADAQIARFRLSVFGANERFLRLRATDAAAFGGLYSTNEPLLPLGSALTLRVTRDGSDVLTFQWGLGTAPMALHTIRDRNTGTYGKPYNPTEAGTAARLEWAIHTPAGPNAAQSADLFVDYYQSV